MDEHRWVGRYELLEIKLVEMNTSLAFAKQNFTAVFVEC